MKKAFTILELIFVIIILGILAAIALPRLNISKDEAELSKSLNNLKILINDLSIYALKNDKLSTLRAMSNVKEIQNVDLSQISGTKEAFFKVGNDDKCIKLIFIDKPNFTLMGIASNDTIKNLIENVANTFSLEALENADFTSNSKDKACVGLSKNENFKNIASKVYVLLGEMSANK